MDKRISQINPAHLAHYEMENYIYYYQRRWLKLGLVSVRLVKEAYQLSILKAIYGAYLIARAEIAFAPHPNNHLSLAKRYIRRFYALVKQAHHGTFDLDQAADCELNWWVIHRRLFADEQNQELVDALAGLLTVVYQIDPQLAYQAARLRAQGMLLSDQWVRQGLDPQSPLLRAEEDRLCESYELLKSALI